MEIRNRYFGPIWDGLVYLLVHADSKEVFEFEFEKTLRNVSFTIEHARGSILRNPHRKLNYRYMVADWLWNWFGKDDLKSILKYDVDAGARSQDGETIFYSWGRNLRRNWSAVKQSLRAGEYWRGFICFTPPDTLASPVNYPRIVSLQFYETEGALNGVVTMLREDVWKTLPYDVHSMCQLVNSMSFELGLDIGSVTFNVSELVLMSENGGPALASIDAKTETHFANRVGDPPEIMKEVLEQAPAMPEIDALECFKVESPWDLYVEVLACLSPYNCHNLLGLRIP